MLATPKGNPNNKKIEVKGSTVWGSLHLSEKRNKKELELIPRASHPQKKRKHTMFLNPNIDDEEEKEKQ